MTTDAAIKILVVDDSPEFVVLLTSLLKFHNIKVESVESGQAAIQKLRNNHYSMIISDYMMDEMDGLELLETVTTTEPRYRGRVMLLTAKNLDGKEIGRVNAIAAMYISKPVMPNEVFKKIQEILDNAETADTQ